MGKLTTHVLDTAQGKPGAEIAVELYSVDGERRLVKSTTTNRDGRTDEPLLDADAFSHGSWELIFSVGDYFEKSNIPADNPPFLDRISIRFNLAKDQHYHVPLLVSPWSYSTYRGS